MFLNSKLNIVNLFTICYLVSSIFYLPFATFSWQLLAFAVFNFFWFGLASSMYYHRCLTHRSFKLAYPVEIFFLIGGLIGLGGDPIKWAAIHRFHHQKSDHDDDTHSPKHGFFWSYYGWVLHHDLPLIEELKHKNSKDLLEKKHLYLAQSIVAESLPHAIYVGVTALFFGLDMAIIGIILPCILSYHAHWMLIASLCHIPRFGYRRFNMPDNSRNLPWLSFLSFGESLHNNHHKYPNYVNLKSAPMEFDISASFVSFLEKLGLASQVKRTNYDKK